MLTQAKHSIMNMGMEQNQILHMRVSEEIRVKLDDLRRAETDIPGRSEMVRRLIQRAQEAAA